jgi:hypothetical protein
MQLGNPSIAYERHIDAADRGRLLRNAHVKGEQTEIPAHVDRPRDGEHEPGQSID